MILRKALQAVRLLGPHTLHFRDSRVVKKALVYVIAQQSYFCTSMFLRSDSKALYEGETKELIVHYKDMLEAQNDDGVLIIDVREQSEIDETGKLPGSIHIPMGDVANILTCLPEEDFKERFVKEKPRKDTKIILSCKSGKRSGMVQEAIQKLGYENTYNYIGGWLDWESNRKV